jgi:iron complex outermembrane receptor protein
MRFFALNPLALAVVAICTAAHAQDTTRTANPAPQNGSTQDSSSQPAAAPQAGDAQTGTTTQRASSASTSNTTNANASQRAIEQAAQQVTVSGQRSIGGGLMSVQSAPKAVSTVTREAIQKAAPGANYAQMIGSIPGVISITDDPSGLFDANYQIRGFTNDEIGVTVNGAPVNDSGSYTVYPTEYGDTENMKDITVLQGYPDVDQAVAGAAGGTIAWSTIDPSHQFGVDTGLSFGSHQYKREFLRVQTGDTGALRSWFSYSNNTTNLWRGKGDAKVDKIDAKSVWTIDAENTVSASLQWNREIRRGGYEKLTKAQAAANYDTNYDTTLTSPTDTNYWALHENPFRDYLLSADGEFTLSKSAHLSIVPYFQYGSGGGGAGFTFTESTSAANVGRFGYVGYDLSGDGVVTNNQKVLTYSYSGADTWRPGVIAKLIKDFGENDTLTAGFWLDSPREKQYQDYSRVDTQGNPLDIWGQNNLVTYKAGGAPQYNFLDTTTTDLTRVFLSNDWTPNDQWTVTVAGAYTNVERKGFGFQHYGATAGPLYSQQFGGYSMDTWKKFTPSAGVKFQLDTANQIYLGYGRSFRAPVNGVVTQSNAVLEYYQKNPAALASSGLTAGQLLSIGINKPETADTVDLGWRYYAGDVSASVDAYASKLQNKQVSGYDDTTGQTVYLSVPKLQQRGLNAEASYKVYKDLSLYASYALTKSTIGEDTATIGDGTYATKGKSFVNVPRNTFYLGESFTHGPFWADVNASYRGSYWADWVNTEKAPGYTTFNLNAGWNFADFGSWLKSPKLKVNVTNLTDRKALTFAPVNDYQANKGVADPTTGKDPSYISAATYNLLAPRSFMVSLSASFL